MIAVSAFRQIIAIGCLYERDPWPLSKRRDEAGGEQSSAEDRAHRHVFNPSEPIEKVPRYESERGEAARKLRAGKPSTPTLPSSYRDISPKMDGNLK